MKLVTITSGVGAKCGKEDEKESTTFHYFLSIKNYVTISCGKSDDTPTWLSFFSTFVASPQHYTLCRRVVIPYSQRDLVGSVDKSDRDSCNY